MKKGFPMKRFFLSIITATFYLAAPASAQIGTIALTFDYYVQDLGAVWIAMNAYGFRGTYYVAPETINKLPDGPIFDHLVLVNQLGNEIGVYTNTPMVDMFVNNRDNAHAKLKSLSDQMEAAGFRVDTIAPNGRQWNVYLGYFSRPRYVGVRVANTGAAIQRYPISNPWNVNDGAALASLGIGTPLASVKAATDAAIAAGGMIVIVIHKIGPVADAYTFATADWNSLLAYWASKGSSLRVVPFREALTPP